MLFITLLGLLATLSFIRLGRKCGLPSGRLASFLMLAAGIVLILLHVSLVVSAVAGHYLVVSRWTQIVIEVGLNGAAMLAYVVVIRRVWSHVLAAAK